MTPGVRNAPTTKVLRLYGDAGERYPRLEERLQKITEWRALYAAKPERKE